MKKLTLTAALFATSAFAESWTGTLSDAGCGLKHADASEASQACAKRCFGRTGAAVLVVGDKVVKIAADSKDKISPHIGHKVVVNGSIKDDVISVDSVKMAE